ncbi:unnamed protein product [Parnassius apollo]|uniref:(apollo) hypothetical protein n=1 Tax=Parnassius apollo TaxID=110799 RepID=A0A8S3WP69_PARAO|nr:unnamed protein product [Parnassius apollo]
MVFLYATLIIIKRSGDYHLIYKTELLTYSDYGIGLSATPAGVNNLPLIWYKDGDSNDYQKYVNAIDELLSANIRKRDAKNFSNLGPCGRSPYGYGDKPCVIIKINKQLGWSVKPMDLNTTNVQNVNSTNFQNVPAKLKELLKFEQRKLLLNCDGYHQYDKEHVGKISYFPDPPGIDANIFPLDMQDNSPLIAIQISHFTLGISIAIECKLWYEGGPSSVQFLLYVSPMTTVV